MNQQANPIPKRGERNIYCPFYGECLDHAVKYSWQSWNCAHCAHNKKRSLPQWEYEMHGTEFGYDVPATVFLATEKRLFDQ
jgi:hypothetical protein